MLSIFHSPVAAATFKVCLCHVLTVCMVNETIVNSRIRVWWTEEKAWYAGRVISVGRGASGSLHTVAYDDGARATHYLQSDESSLNETWEIEPSPDESKTLAKHVAKASTGGRQRQPPVAAGPTLARGPAKGAQKKWAAPTAEETGAAKAAVRQAAAEGLTLQLSGSATGYRCVHIDSKNKTNPFKVQVKRAGKEVYLGSFATAEDAALTYARTAEARAGAAAKSVPLTAEEVVARAAAEQLTLVPSNNASGYKNVACHKQTGRYQAKITHNGKVVRHGSFGSAEEAALAVARATARTTMLPAAAPRPAAARHAAPPPRPPPAKQPRNSLELRPINSAAPPSAPALGVSVEVAPAPATFKDKLALLKRQLDIKPAIPAIPAIAEANELLGITPSSGDSLGAQLDTVLAAISC